MRGFHPLWLLASLLVASVYSAVDSSFIPPPPSLVDDPLLDSDGLDEHAAATPPPIPPAGADSTVQTNAGRVQDIIHDIPLVQTPLGMGAMADGSI